MLTDAQCRKLPDCPTSPRPVRHADFGGMYLEISPSGARVWYWKYRFDGKEKRLRLGAFPTMLIAQARAERDKARDELKAGKDPAIERKLIAQRNVDVASNTFERLARDYHNTHKDEWSQSYGDRWISLMEQKIFPELGSIPIGMIQSPDLMRVLRVVEKAGRLESAHTLRQWCGQVFRFGASLGHCTHDIAAPLADQLKKVQTQSYAAVVKPDELRVLLDAIDATRGDYRTRVMLTIASLTGQRPLNVRSMEWAHVDLDAGMWHIPAPNMKLRKDQKAKRDYDHYVPLSKQAVAVLREIEPTTKRRFVFPGAVDPNKPASEATMNAALKRGGIPTSMHVPHGFRATLLTMGQEQCGLSKAVLDSALAHAKEGPLGDTYDRTEWLQERAEALQVWADYLDRIRADDNVIKLRKAA